MARSDGYNTKTRQLILDYLINNRQHAVSASNILEHLEEQGASPNPTTVYRYLDKLAGEQRIMKYVADKGEKAVFQYVDEGRHCREHLHLKCVQCGRIYHLDCHFMDEVRAHLMAEQGARLPVDSMQSDTYTVIAPVRTKAGQLQKQKLLVPKAASAVHYGYLPYASNNLLSSAFKFYGKPYGWGGLKNSVDCSSLIFNAYRTVGIVLPRNADQQELTAGTKKKLSGSSQERAAVIRWHGGIWICFSGSGMFSIREKWIITC